jgi:hypothetical protein
MSKPQIALPDNFEYVEWGEEWNPHACQRLPPGACLDIAIEHHLFGAEHVKMLGGGPYTFESRESGVGGRTPHYSTDMEATDKILAHLSQLPEFYLFWTTSDTRWDHVVTLKYGDRSHLVWGRSDFSLQHAVCLAALSYVEFKDARE